MPLYEYRCADCAKTFELLVRSSTVPQCPHCASLKLTRLMSAFTRGSPAWTTTYVPPGTRDHPGDG